MQKKSEIVKHKVLLWRNRLNWYNIWLNWPKWEVAYVWHCLMWQYATSRKSGYSVQNWSQWLHIRCHSILKISWFYMHDIRLIRASLRCPCWIGHELFIYSNFSIAFLNIMFAQQRLFFNNLDLHVKAECSLYLIIFTFESILLYANKICK